MIDYQNELNKEQLDAVWHGDGPCLVLAGAGSGKTRVITYRVAYLLEQGIDPQNILLVTFTNKAADEMKRRVTSLVLSSRARDCHPERSEGSLSESFGQPDRDSSHTQNDSHGELPWAGTFHHIAYRILRQYAPLLGFKNNFSVLDSDDSEALIKICAKNYKIEGEGKKFPSAKVLLSVISYARNSEMSVADVLELRNPQWQMFSGQIKSISDDYYRKKKEANAMDFDDLLVNLLLLLNNENVLQKFANQFKYVLVDEYQDTNKIQASIIKKLASVHHNILVVGDDAQSIYSFRAADVQNILQFEKDYPGTKIFKLETNYRSSHEILQVANDVIANNVKQYKKELKTVTKSGLKPSLHPQMDQSGEAEFVAGKIVELIDSGTPENEIAVLFRAAYHSQMLEMELVKAGIAYDYRGGLRFFERAHVKDTLAYLRILNNFADTAAWMRVLMHEEGIGPGAAGKIVEALKTVTNIEEVKIIGQQVLGEKAKNGWYNFVRIWEAMLSATCHSERSEESLSQSPNGQRSFASTQDDRSPATLIDSIINSPYKDYLEAEYIDSKDRLEDIAQLQVFAKKYNELEQFLAEASLQESFQIKNNQQRTINNRPESKVVLSTIHQAKGLEWSAVFIINLASGAFPGDRAFREPNGLEEERRLFYVAITRAKKHLHLTYPMASTGWGDSLSGPSIFLGEISSDLLDDHSLLSMNNGLVLNDEEAGVTYEPEDPGFAKATPGKPLRIKPGSFLRSVEDL